MSDCKTCIHSEIGHGEGNGCTAWTCEYIKKKEALKAYKEQMEIVRCKDCKYHSQYVGALGNYCTYVLHCTKDDFYCADGERKDE